MGAISVLQIEPVAQNVDPLPERQNIPNLGEGVAIKLLNFFNFKLENGVETNCNIQ